MVGFDTLVSDVGLISVLAGPLKRRLAGLIQPIVQPVVQRAVRCKHRVMEVDLDRESGRLLVVVRCHLV